MLSLKMMLGNSKTSWYWLILPQPTFMFLAIGKKTWQESLAFEYSFYL